jgi:hypothetical protein
MLFLMICEKGQKIMIKSKKMTAFKELEKS